MSKSSLKKILIISVFVLFFGACLPIFFFGRVDSPRQNVFKNIPSSNSLKYLYSDIEFSAPQDIPSSKCEALNLEFIKKFPGYNKQCLSISYKIIGYKSYAVLIKSAMASNLTTPNLLVYNHGHEGLPAESENFAYKFIVGALEAGNDVLLVSMPFTGVEKQYQSIMVKTWDGVTNYDPKDLEATPAAWHGVFEMFDTGSSHYMRFFMDSAVLNVLSMKNQYKKISFVGLSGGATTGLYACTVLKDILSNCILVAGVMPLKYRFTKNNFGDSEQVSSSFYKKNKVIDLVKEISRSKTRLQLIYNDKDACCFSGESARLFKEDLAVNSVNNVNFIIRDSVAHDYDPDFILSSISSN